MEHGSYKVSEETKDRLVNAAGELFSFHGTDTVTLREIADRAGAVPNAVCYHFGDKEGLVEAVRQYALRLWDDGRIERYYQENESLLATRDGRRQMVTDTIDLYYGILCAEGQPRWVIRLLLRAKLTSQWQGKRHETIARQIIETFCRIYEKISGNDDRNLLGDGHHRPWHASGGVRIRFCQLQEERPHRLRVPAASAGDGYTQRPLVAWA